MNGLVTVLAAFVGMGVLGGILAYGTFEALRVAWRRWKDPQPSSRYALPPLGEPGVHDELGTPGMQKTRWRLDAARRHLPVQGGRWLDLPTFAAHHQTYDHVEDAAASDGAAVKQSVAEQQSVDIHQFRRRAVRFRE